MNENDKTIRESHFPEVWPGWETVEELGKGSYGAVYKICRELGSYTEYAAAKRISIPNDPAEVRALRQNGYDDESITENYREQSEKFLQEYALMRSLNGNTNIVNCDDVKKVPHADGVGADIYIKMELLTPLGETASGELSEEMVIRIGTDLCQALELCEKNGIIHRDIKPANIFVSKNGDYKLGDFGVSRIMEGTTTDGTVTGTPRFMAPEVYGNRGYNRTADIYSLGLVLYWLLNERRTPFQPLPPAKLGHSGDQEAMNRRMKGEVIPEPKNGSKALKKIVLKACAYDPKERYQSASEMKNALMLLREPKREPKPIPKNDPEPKPTPKPPKPKKTLWLLALIPLLLVGEFFILRGNDRPEAVQDSADKKYDSAGNLTKQTYYNPDGSVYSWVEYEYDSTGNYTKTKEYNADGHLMAKSDYDSAGNRTKLTFYASNGRRSNEIDYDSAGNQTKTTYYDPDGSVYSWAEYEYDSTGNRMKQTVYNADGSVRKWYKSEYDSTGKLTKQTEYSPDGTVTFVRDYDSAGNRTQTTQYKMDGSIEYWYKFEYDDVGNQIRETWYNADGSMNYRYEYEYDAGGNLTKTTRYNADGSVDNFTGHYYEVINKNMTWEQAKEYADNHGGHLATITSEKEELLIENLLSDEPMHQYWLGGKRLFASNAEFSWVTGEPFTYTKWETGQPDNYQNIEYYLQIRKLSNGKAGSSDGTNDQMVWNDATNDNYSSRGEDYFVGFIVEYDN